MVPPPDEEASEETVFSPAVARDPVVFPKDEEAEEDAPLPCLHTSFLDYLAIGHDAAVSEYVEMLKTHINPETVSVVPELMELFTSELALSVFVPKEWHGLKNFEPYEMNFRKDLPASLSAKARPVNPALLEAAKKECLRLCTYILVPSVSPYASALVIAMKKTAPYCRFCGDYTIINRYIIKEQRYIPNVQYEIAKAAGFSIFCDLDMTNSFHQIPLAEKTSNILSIQTIWGLFRPIFLPEGCPNNSGLLQQYVTTIFSDFLTWMIVIYDNFLVCAHNPKDLYEKCKLVLERCAEYRVTLKMAKSWVGFKKVTFFGFELEDSKVSISRERKEQIEKHLIS